MEPTPPPRSQPQRQLAYVDRPEISETFVDSLWRVYFDGQTIRMDFVVNRMDDPRPQTPPSGKAVTASRIVIPVAGMVEMLSKLQNLADQLRAQGTVRQISAPEGVQRTH